MSERGEIDLFGCFFCSDHRRASLRAFNSNFNSGVPVGDHRAMKAKRWTQAEENRLRRFYPGHSQKECLLLFPGRTLKAISSRAKLLGLKTGNHEPWPILHIKILRKMYADTATQKIADLIKRDLQSVYRKAGKLGLAKSAAYMASPSACRLRRGDNVGIAYRYPKGHVPANKGTRRPGWSAGRMRETQFKKGQRPRNSMPVGSIRIIDGYLYLKISDAPEPPGKKGGSSPNWVLLHKKVFEDAGNPPFNTRTHALIFKDGNRRNCALENLALITRAENCRRNSVHRLPEKLKRVVFLKAAINRRITIHERKKRHGGTEHPGHAPRPSI